MQNDCVRTKKDRRRLRVYWGTAAPEHGRSYAIKDTVAWKERPLQGLPRKRLLKIVVSREA